MESYDITSNRPIAETFDYKLLITTMYISINNNHLCIFKRISISKWGWHSDIITYWDLFILSH